MYKIQSDNRSAAISAAGAELQSLIATGSGEEFMWSGDPAIWSGRAPVLFPFVGGLRCDQFSFGGKSYAMEKHGFARRQTFGVQSHSEQQLILVLRSNDSLLQIYPWQFELQVDFRFEDDVLCIDYLISNHDSCAMAFNIGSHPAFRLPLSSASINDYQVRFDKNETLDTYRVVDALLEPQSYPCLDNASLIQLTPSLFDEDALVFKHIKSTLISLEHRALGPRVSVDTGGAPHLGLWAKPAAPYVCIEPWWGHADFNNETGDIFSKQSVQTLLPGEQFKTGIKVATFDPL